MDKKDQAVSMKTIAIAIFIITILGGVLVAISGVWPPFAYITSESMEPTINNGDVIYFVDETRFNSMYADENGIITFQNTSSRRNNVLAGNGSIILFQPPNSSELPTVHRTMMWVEKEENWYDKSDKLHVYGALNCEELRNCPAPHSGYITKGDANRPYDQALGMYGPVKKDWIIGKVVYTIPTGSLTAKHNETN